VLVLIAIVMTIPLVWGGIRVGQDTATQFYPWYSYLGEQLRAGRVPEWNPHQFSGTPFAGDPQSGWTYLPAMVLFTLLPLTPAVVLFLFLHLLLASLGACFLARRIGLSEVGAVAAGVCYAYTGAIYGRTASGPASVEVGTWFPWLLLGFEIAVQATTARARLAGWTLSALAVSQLLAAWVGQLSYYMFLVLAAYALYRIATSLWSQRLIAEVRGTVQIAGSWWRRLGAIAPSVVRLFVRHGLTIMLLGLLLAAAGLLPRFEFNLVSNAEGGEYSSDTAVTTPGTTRDSAIEGFFGPSVNYPGAATLALAVYGVLLVRRRLMVPFWLFICAVAVIFTVTSDSPLHWLFYTFLPQFEALHSHHPERVILVTYLPLALIAGAGLQAIVERRFPQRWGAVISVVPLVIVFIFRLLGASISWVSLFAIIGVIAVTLARVITTMRLRLNHSVSRGRPTRRISPGGAYRAVGATLLVVICADLLLTNVALDRQAPFGGFYHVDLDAYYAPTGGARFLQEQSAADGPFRYAGYDPDVSTIENGETVFYRHQFGDPRTAQLLVNNRAIVLGLEDTQGYNPLQIQRYVDVVNAMNSGPQEYHGTNIYPSGLTSPLLDLLNVRYLIIPAVFGEDRPDLEFLTRTWTTVYTDAEVRIVENPDVLPRAWLVYQAREVAEGEALPLLASGAVDPRTTVLLEDDVPTEVLAVTSATGAGSVAIHETNDPDTMRFTVTTEQPGLLVLSEIACPAWVATVDGAETEILPANHALRAISVPAGTHEVELRYDSPATRIGLGITVATIVGLAVAFVVTTRRPRPVEGMWAPRGWPGAPRRR
jgi:hypothetical protein